MSRKALLLAVFLLSVVAAPAQGADEAPKSPRSLRARAAARAQLNQPAKVSENKQRPVNLEWRVVGGFPSLPGALMLRGQVGSYFSNVPLFIGGSATYSFGPLPKKEYDSRERYMGGYVTGNLQLEGRAGVSFERWDNVTREVKIEKSRRGRGTYIEVEYSVYYPSVPTYRRNTFYTGYRTRSVPGLKPCDAIPTGICSELPADFLMLGYEFLRAYHMSFHTREHGEVTTRSRDFVGFHLLWATTGAGRERVLDRIGGEFYWTRSRSAAISGYSIGWDGRYALFAVNLGFGMTHSFGGHAPE